MYHVTTIHVRTSLASMQTSICDKTMFEPIVSRRGVDQLATASCKDYGGHRFKP